MFRTIAVGWLPIILVTLLAAGCATHRKVTIGAQPTDAIIKIDGVEVGRGPVTRTFEFAGPEDVHRVTALRAGYKEDGVTLRRDFRQRELLIQLKPLTRQIHLSVEPAPAIVSIDGKRLSDEPVQQVSRELVFTLDDHNRWTSYVVTAEREGFAPARQVVTWTDDSPNYTLQLQPMRKDVRVSTNPQGALVSLDDRPIGQSPTTAPAVGFYVEPQSGQWTTHVLRVEKPGYEPIEQAISWEEGKTDYAIDFQAKRKQVRVITDPPGAMVAIDGQEVTQRDDMGVATTELAFPPVNDQGDLKTYELSVSKKSPEAEYYPTTRPIGWDEGKPEYIVRLKEVLSRPVDLASVEMRRSDNAWHAEAVTQSTLAMKKLSEGELDSIPLRLARSPANGIIDTLAVSPDGARIVYNVLYSGGGGDADAELRSQIMLVRADGSGGGPAILTDGRTLDLTPSFVPDGASIVFSSNRATARQSVWKMDANGAPGVTQLTSGETNDLWPVIDSDPKPRLFYQAYIDSRPEPKLFMTRLGTVARTDLTEVAGDQPRVSPKADRLVFVGINAKTKKRDLYLMPDSGGVPENLTDTPDIDEFDPVWSRDGRRIAFAADRGLDDEKRANYDIWTMDVNNPGQPTQITTNGSRDDRPAWDPAGKFIYFRSNRGGEWAIWRIALTAE